MKNDATVTERKSKYRKLELIFIIIFVISVCISSCVIMKIVNDYSYTTSSEIEEIDDVIVSIWQKGLTVECEDLRFNGGVINLADLSTKSLNVPENQDVSFCFSLNGLNLKKVKDSIFVYKQMGVNEFEFDFSDNSLEIKLHTNFIVVFLIFIVSFILSYILCVFMIFLISLAIDAYCYIKKDRKEFVLVESFFSIFR